MGVLIPNISFIIGHTVAFEHRCLLTSSLGAHAAGFFSWDINPLTPNNRDCQAMSERPPPLKRANNSATRYIGQMFCL